MAGYGVGMGLVALASVFLLRYLGVVDFGRYITVVSLMAIVAGLSDAGLTVVGQREYVLRDPPRQRQLLADIIGIRLVLTPLGVLAASGFALLAGYRSDMVIGTLIAGVGLILVNAALSLTLPLSSTLRLGAVTVTDVARQAALTLGIAVLVATGADLLAFFGVQVFSGLILLIVTIAMLGRGAVVAPRFSWSEWWPLLRDAGPVTASLVVNVVYVRALIIMVSLLAGGVATGLFATSSRILEIMVGIPNLMIGAAYPILSHAGAHDEARLGYALQRLAEASLVLAAGLAVIIALAADPLVQALGGTEYEGAATVLRVQSVALLGAFLTPVWTFGLAAIRRQFALIVINAMALVSVLTAGLLMIPPLGAQGAAIAAAVGEAVLAGVALIMLVRARPALMPELGFVWKIGLAAAVALGSALVPGLPDAAVAVLGATAYAVTIGLLGVVPLEALHAFTRRKAAAT